jgi:predicted kinase
VIDAEYTEEATVENFDRLRPRLVEGAVVVVDDIFLSDEMRRAGETIQARPGVDLVYIRCAGSESWWRGSSVSA